MSKNKNNGLVDDRKIKRVKFTEEQFTTINLNMYVHGSKDYSIGFINSDNKFNIDKFINYFIKEVCENTNSPTIVYKYMQILEKIKSQIDIYGITDIESIMIYLINKFVIFVNKFNLINNLESEIKLVPDDKFEPHKLISIINEKIVVDKLLVLKNQVNKIIDLNECYIDIIQELIIYKSLIKEQTWLLSVKYLRGFYSIYLTLLMDIFYNLDKIKSFESLIKEYDINLLNGLNLFKINDFAKLFHELNVTKYHDCIKLLI